jgi:hypothetical protein
MKKNDGEITTNPVRNSLSQKLFLLARVQPILGAGGRQRGLSVSKAGVHSRVHGRVRTQNGGWA